MEKDIGKIQKRDDTDIILRIDDFAEKRGFTIREFVTSERYTGFTKAGVRILAKDWLKFKEMINSVDDADMKEEAPVSAPEEQETLPEAAPAPTPEAAPEAPVEAPKEEAPSKEELPDY
jgi:hypothetical protein